MEYKTSCLHHFNQFGYVHHETVFLFIDENNAPQFRKSDNCGNYEECEDCKERSIKWFVNHLLEQSQS